MNRETIKTSDIPEPTAPSARAQRKGSPSLAKPLAAVALVVALALVAFLFFADDDSTPEGVATETTTSEAVPGVDVIEGQGAEPEGTGGVLEPGMLPDVERPVLPPSAETGAETGAESGGETGEESGGDAAPGQ